MQKVSIDAGFTCPNVDGTVATGGCTFCDNRSFSPSRRLPRAGIRGQIDRLGIGLSYTTVLSRSGIHDDGASLLLSYRF